MQVAAAIQWMHPADWAQPIHILNPPSMTILAVLTAETLTLTTEIPDYEPTL